MATRILITGGSGFVGACLTRSLIQAGDDVHLLLRPESSLWRLAEVQGHYTPHEADLRDADAVRRVVADCRPDVVYHLATHGVYPFQTDRAAIFSTNVLGTANLLEALEHGDYRAFVHVGSSSEYGHKARPIRETDRLEPRTDYAVAKASATLLCQAQAPRGRPVAIVRIFSAYGPWEERTRLVPYVMGCCLRGEVAEIVSGGQPRDFIYVEDVVRLLKLAAQTPEARGRILHAGTGRQHTVRDMVETILDVCGGEARFADEPPRADEPRSWVASIEQTTAITGWKPRHDLRSGIEHTWQWFVGFAKPLAARNRKPLYVQR